MTPSFVDALADAIVSCLVPEGAHAGGTIVASRGTRRTGVASRSRVAGSKLRVRHDGCPPGPLADLDPLAFERVASAIVAQLARIESQQELPLDTIEI